MTTTMGVIARSSEGALNLSANVKRVQSVTSLITKAGQTPADNGARIEKSCFVRQKRQTKEQVSMWSLLL